MCFKMIQYNHIMKLFVRLSCGKVQKPASPLKSELPWNQTDQNKKNQKRKTSLVLRLHETTDNDCPNIPTKNQNVSWNIQKCLEIATDPGKKENKCVLFSGWMILGSFWVPKMLGKPSKPIRRKQQQQQQQQPPQQQPQPQPPPPPTTTPTHRSCKFNSIPQFWLFDQNLGVFLNGSVATNNYQ